MKLTSFPLPQISKQVRCQSLIYDELGFGYRVWLLLVVRWLVFRANGYRVRWISPLRWLQEEVQHRRACFFCRRSIDAPGESGMSAIGLCLRHFLLFEARIVWFQLRTGQLGRWKR